MCVALSVLNIGTVIGADDKPTVDATFDRSHFELEELSSDPLVLTKEAQKTLRAIALLSGDYSSPFVSLLEEIALQAYKMGARAVTEGKDVPYENPPSR